MKLALYVSAFLPDEFSPHAGGQAAYQNRIDLERLGYSVTSLICTTEVFSGKDSIGMTVFRQSWRTAFVGYLANLLMGRVGGLFSWHLLDTRANLTFERRLYRELHSTSYELLFVDFTQAMPPALRALRSLRKRPTTRCCAHDLYIQKLIREESLASRWFLGQVARTERALLRSFDEVITLSEKDQALVRQLYDCSAVGVRPWTPPRWTATVRRPAHVNLPYEVLFFANFGRPENAEAVCWMLEVAWPFILRQLPSARLVLAGAGSDEVVLPVGTKNVRAVGFLENPAVVFESCRVAVAPLMRGAGVKFKVLEALACGVMVVGTSVALEGIARSPLLIEATRHTFVDALIRALTSEPVQEDTPALA